MRKYMCVLVLYSFFCVLWSGITDKLEDVQKSIESLGNDFPELQSFVNSLITYPELNDVLQGWRQQYLFAFILITASGLTFCIISHKKSQNDISKETSHIKIAKKAMLIIFFAGIIHFILYSFNYSYCSMKMRYSYCTSGIPRHINSLWHASFLLKEIGMKVLEQKERLDCSLVLLIAGMSYFVIESFVKKSNDSKKAVDNYMIIIMAIVFIFGLYRYASINDHYRAERTFSLWAAYGHRFSFDDIKVSRAEAIDALRDINKEMDCWHDKYHGVGVPINLIIASFIYFFILSVRRRLLPP